MATAVKFYSVAALPASPAANGLYFVDGGELYKGSSRFGLGRVTALAALPTDAARGDINVSDGVAKVYDGTAWRTLGATVELVGASSGTGTLVTGVAQADGKVQAYSQSIKDATDGMVDVSTKTLTATNLTVSDTATFNVTTVSANALTVNGKTVEEIADSRITASTLAGSISSSTGTSLVNEGQVVGYVSERLKSLDNAMHFLGVGTVTETEVDGKYTIAVTAPAGTTPAKGDIVIDSSTGLEAICTDATGPKWELIGDNGVYATKADFESLKSTMTGGSSNATDDGVKVTVATAAITAVPTVTVEVTGATTVGEDENVTTVVTAGAVAKALNAMGGTSASSANGIKATVATAAVSAAPTVTVEVTPAAEIKSDAGTSVVTEGVVKKYVDNALTDAALVWLGADGKAL